MKLKNIYLVQASEKFSINNKSAYLPYAAGTVAAHAWNNESVRETYCLKRIVFLREPIDELTVSLENPYLIGFSCYLWNFEYSKAAAEKIKASFPSCLIVFGGHNVSSDTSLLDECPYIDILVHGEGEEVFEKLLCSLASNASLSDVPNISFRNAVSVAVQSPKALITGSDYPSPYITGVFERIIQHNPDIKFSAILETNRGCANNCAFCDWGPHKTKVRMFPLDRIKEDINWFSDNKIEYIWGADANFGQFERDAQIADWIIEAKQKNGYPVRIKVNYAKYNNQNVFELSKRFSDADLSKSTTISFQTLSDCALKNIGRSNMTMAHFSELITLYRKDDIPTYTELILALPGETYESFTDGMGRLIDSGQHSVIEVYDCVLLPNSVIAGKEYIRQHRIQSVHVPFFQYHCEDTNDDVTEYWDIVISTGTMQVEDWIKSKLFTVAVQSMHCLGLLRCFAVYLRNEKQLEYKYFYLRLLEWYAARPQTICGRILTNMVKLFEKMTAGVNEQYYYDIRYGDVRWPLDEGIFLCLISEIDLFYDDIRLFLKTFNLDEPVLEQLMVYQKNIICKPSGEAFGFSLDYDFYTYFLNSLKNSYVPLIRVKNTVTIHTCGDFTSLSEYAREVVWYGRRLGRSIYTNNPEHVDVIYHTELHSDKILAEDQ